MGTDKQGCVQKRMIKMEIGIKKKKNCTNNAYKNEGCLFQEKRHDYIHYTFDGLSSQRRNRFILYQQMEKEGPVGRSSQLNITTLTKQFLFIHITLHITLQR